MAAARKTVLIDVQRRAKQQTTLSIETDPAGQYFSLFKSGFGMTVSTCGWRPRVRPDCKLVPLQRKQPLDASDIYGRAGDI